MHACEVVPAIWHDSAACTWWSQSQSQVASQDASPLLLPRMYGRLFPCFLEFLGAPIPRAGLVSYLVACAPPGISVCPNKAIQSCALRTAEQRTPFGPIDSAASVLVHSRKQQKANVATLLSFRLSTLCLTAERSRRDSLLSLWNTGQKAFDRCGSQQPARILSDIELLAVASREYSCDVYSLYCKHSSVAPRSWLQQGASACSKQICKSQHHPSGSRSVWMLTL